MVYQYPTCGVMPTRMRAPRNQQGASWSSSVLSNAPHVCKGRNSKSPDLLCLGNSEKTNLNPG